MMIFLTILVETTLALTQFQQIQFQLLNYQPQGKPLFALLSIFIVLISSQRLMTFSFAFCYDVTTFVLESNADKWLERVKGTKIFSTKHSSATSIIYTYRYPIEQLSLHTNDFWDNVHDHLFVLVSSSRQLQDRMS